MARGRDFLERFRPVGTPGAAGRRGVPADRVADLAAELGPVLALLDATQAECTALRREADEQASARREQARVRAAAHLAQARADAEGERAGASARLAARAQAEAEQAREAGQRETDQVRENAAERLPALVAAAEAVMTARLDDVLGSTA
jgi:hypothetical protein